MTDSSSSSQPDETPSAKNINTKGGSYIEGSANTKGGDIVSKQIKFVFQIFFPRQASVRRGQPDKGLEPSHQEPTSSDPENGQEDTRRRILQAILIPALILLAFLALAMLFQPR